MSQSPSLSQLQELNPFLRRHLGPDASEQKAMLDALGIASRTELIEQTVPRASAWPARWTFRPPG